MSTWETLHQDAIALHQQEDWTAAEQQYQTLLQQNNQADAVWGDLGWLYYQTQRYPAARSALAQALKLNPTAALHFYRYGLTLEQLGDRAQAIWAQRQATQHNPQFIDAYLALGRLLAATGDLESATASYQQAIAIDPNRATAHQGLAQVFLGRGQISSALQTYTTACQLSPHDMTLMHELAATLQLQANYEQARAAFYLGSAAYARNDYRSALQHYQNFLDIPQKEAAPATIQRVYKYVGECHQKLEQPSEALQVYEQGLAAYPQAKELYVDLIALLQNSGQTEEAIAVAERGLQYLPNDIQLQRSQQLMLPILYESEAEIEVWRQRFSQGLECLIQHTQLDTIESRQTALLGVGYQTNFYLQYQGKEDRDLQVKYGQLIHRIVTANYPQWSHPVPMPELGSDRKIRVGYISSCLWGHTVGKLFSGWVRHHNPQVCEVFCYHIGQTVDAITETFRQHSHTFRHLPLQDNLEADFTTTAQVIRQDELHVLVFLDLGMHPFLTSLAGLRLAPIQCVSWGHPITSGLPTIDYFLSSELMEPDTGDRSYAEQLIRLPNLGIAYTKPNLPKLSKTRSHFQLREEAIVYLCCQSLFKYLPQHDFILVETAQQVPQAQFVFVSGFNSLLTKRFTQRLQRAFAAVGLDASDYCVILSRQEQEDYWQLNLLSDVFLDTLSWSGGNTTLEAIACDLPVVTYPGGFMRGRHSYAILQRLNASETIAQTVEEYIEIAVKLGKDEQWRSQIVQKMRDHHHQLYDDPACVIALETFYQQAISSYLNG